ncbi:MAG: hypothetical protein ACMVO3_22470 [Thalassobaculum sp.]
MALPARRRERYRLDRFDPERDVSASDAFIDRLHIRVNSYSFSFPSTSDIGSFLNAFGRSSVFRRSGPIAAGSRNRFQVPTGVSSPWLFSGEISFNGRGPRMNASIRLWLNPIRFAAHRGLGLDQVRDMPAAEALSADPRRETAIRNWSLDRSDNMVPAQMAAHPSDWIEYAGVYFGKVRDLIDAEIGAALASADMTRQLAEGRWGDVVVPEAEVAWEFRQPQALSAVHAFIPRLRAVAQALEVTVYETGRSSHSSQATGIRHRTRHNAVQAAVSVLGEDKSAIEVAFYAKEHDRLRLEVRYQRNLRQMLRSRLVGIPRDFASLPDYLAAVREDGADRLNRVLGAADLVPERADDDVASYFDLAGKVAEACEGRSDLVAQVLELLTVHGGLSAINEELSVISHRLARLGVLRQSSTRLRSRERRYALVREFALSVEGFARHGVND